jgi:hypothetical protein
MMNRARSLLIALAISVGAAVAGCGDDDSTDGAEESTVTAEQAVTEIAKVRSGLDEALATYADGNADEAQTVAEDAYLEHFELVEGPLEEADPELNEELEEAIREEFTGEIESGAPLRDLQALGDQIDRGLTEAENALNAGS